MPAKKRHVGTSTPRAARVRRPDWQGLACGAILEAGAFAVYGNSFGAPLHFDDLTAITETLSIRRLWPVGPVLLPPDETGVGGRPLFNLSYALNYAFGGAAVSGYQLVNLLIHVLAAWTLFALVRRSLQSPVLAPHFGHAANPLALAVSAIWEWHPVQTESVTYLSQPAESRPTMSRSSRLSRRSRQEFVRRGHERADGTGSPRFSHSGQVASSKRPGGAAPFPQTDMRPSQFAP